jgi:glycine cleavage system H lipoate-binding protein
MSDVRCFKVPTSNGKWKRIKKQVDEMETTRLETRIENRLTHKPNRCIWMQAGVIRRKYCESDFDCISCRFDRALRRAAQENRELRTQGRTPVGKQAKIVFWKDRLRDLPPAKRPCIHHMKGRITFRACTHDYHCGNCEFDQYFYDQYAVHTVIRPVDVLDIDGFKIPQGFYLHPGHTWMKIEEGEEVGVGIDDFATRLLGPLDRIEPPLLGKEVKQGRADISAKRGGHRAAFLSPISGVVTGVNFKLREEGSPAGQDPYSEGWVVRVHSDTLRSELKHLMIGSETEPFFEKELGRLSRVIEEELGPLAADGGYLGRDIYGCLPDASWDRLTSMFLRTY